jgi:serine/threonine protein kinase
MWAFGCILAELAVNEPLFNGDSEIEQLYKIFRFIGSPNPVNYRQIADGEFKPIYPFWT